VATDFLKIAKDLTPHFWRLDVFNAYRDSSIEALQTFVDSFEAFQDETRDCIKWTGQHRVLEKLLTEYYSVTDAEIYIVENDFVDSFEDLYLDGETDPDPLTLYTDAELPVGGYNPPTLYLDGEGSGQPHFTVFVSVAVTFSEPVLRGVIDKYVIAGKVYDVQTF